MAAKLFLLVVATAVFSVARADENGCICDELRIEKERDAVWRFIMRLKAKDDEDLPVIPGVLGPLVPCGNCIEYSRKKRTVLPQLPSVEDLGERSVHRYDRRCPAGYYRVAGNCIPEEFLEY